MCASAKRSPALISQEASGRVGAMVHANSSVPLSNSFFKDLFCIYTVSLGRSTSAAPAVQNLLSLHKEL